MTEHRLEVLYEGSGLRHEGQAPAELPLSTIIERQGGFLSVLQPLLALAINSNQDEAAGGPQSFDVTG
jgi:hypothetical protein